MCKVWGTISSSVIDIQVEIRVSGMHFQVFHGIGDWSTTYRSLLNLFRFCRCEIGFKQQTKVFFNVEELIRRSKVMELIMIMYVV